MEAYKRRYQQMIDTRLEYPSRRMEVQYRCNNIQDSLHHLRESFEQAIRNGKASQPGSVTVKSKGRSRRRHMRSQANSDMDVLHARVKDLNLLMEDLNGHDRHVENAEKAFDNASRAMFTALHANTLVRDDYGWTEASLKPSSAYRSLLSTSSGPPMLPQLAEYYDAVSDLKIMRERLNDLRVERQEQWERRVLLVDQEAFFGPSDDDFHSEWRQSLEIAEKDLRCANDAVMNTRQACIDVQISIPSWAAISLSSYATDEDPRAPHRAEPLGSLNSVVVADTPAPQIATGVKVISTISAHDLPRGSSPLLTPPINQSTVREKVDRWLENIQEEVVTTTTSEHGTPDGTNFWNANRRLDVGLRGGKCLSSPASL